MCEYEKSGRGGRVHSLSLFVVVVVVVVDLDLDVGYHVHFTAPQLLVFLFFSHPRLL